MNVAWQSLGSTNSWEGSRRTRNRRSGRTYLMLNTMESAYDALDALDAEDFGDTASRLQVAPVSPEQTLSAVVEKLHERLTPPCLRMTRQVRA